MRKAIHSIEWLSYFWFMIICLIAILVQLVYPQLPGKMPGEKIIYGKAVRIADGDTFTLLTDDKQNIRIRLNGIDAPEKTQPFFQVSRERLATLLNNHRIRIMVTGSDRYGRLLADVFVPGNDSSVNLRLVAAGLAWHFIRYSSDPVLAQAETQARVRQLGLWKQHTPQAPWTFRAAIRTKNSLKKKGIADPLLKGF